MPRVPKRKLPPKATQYYSLKKKLRQAVHKACHEFNDDMFKLLKSFEPEYREVWIKLMVKSNLDDKKLSEYKQYDWLDRTNVFNDLRESWLHFLSDHGIKLDYSASVFNTCIHAGPTVKLEGMDLIFPFDCPKISIKIARQEQMLAFSTCPLPQEIQRMVYDYVTNANGSVHPHRS